MAREAFRAVRRSVCCWRRAETVPGRSKRQTPREPPRLGQPTPCPIPTPPACAPEGRDQQHETAIAQRGREAIICFVWRTAYT